MRRFGPGLVVAAVAACAPQGPPTMVTPVSNQAIAQGGSDGPMIGDYNCRIQESGYEYPAFRCIIRPDGGRTVLEKIEGTVRFRGVIASTAGGFGFAGEVYCPWGDCTEPVRAQFRAAGGGIFIASFNARRAGPAMTVTLEPLDGQDGGYSYGGYGYGGSLYGGGGPNR